MKISEGNGTNNVIIKSAVKFFTKIIMIPNCSSQILPYTAHTVQINNARCILNSRGFALSTPPPPQRAEVKEKVDVYLYTPYGPSWPVVG
jgi:hypothetical protein